MEYTAGGSSLINDQFKRQQISTIKILNRYYPIFKGINTVGRHKDATINIKDLNVSQHHAVIAVFDDHNQFISDLTSTNATFLNGTKIIPYQLVKLEGNCNISFGSVLGHFYVGVLTGTYSEEDSRNESQSVYCANTQKNNDTEIDLHLAPTQVINLQENECFLKPNTEKSLLIRLDNKNSSVTDEVIPSTEDIHLAPTQKINLEENAPLEQPNPNSKNATPKNDFSDDIHDAPTETVHFSQSNTEKPFYEMETQVFDIRGLGEQSNNPEKTDTLIVTSIESDIKQTHELSITGMVENDGETPDLGLNENIFTKEKSVRLKINESQEQETQVEDIQGLGEIFDKIDDTSMEISVNEKYPSISHENCPANIVGETPDLVVNEDILIKKKSVPLKIDESDEQETQVEDIQELSEISDKIDQTSMVISVKEKYPSNLHENVTKNIIGKENFIPDVGETPDLVINEDILIKKKSVPLKIDESEEQETEVEHIQELSKISDKIETSMVISVKEKYPSNPHEICSENMQNNQDTSYLAVNEDIPIKKKHAGDGENKENDDDTPELGINEDIFIKKKSIRLRNDDSDEEENIKPKNVIPSSEEDETDVEDNLAGKDSYLIQDSDSEEEKKIDDHGSNDSLNFSIPATPYKNNMSCLNETDCIPATQDCVSSFTADKFVEKNRRFVFDAKHVNNIVDNNSMVIGESALIGDVGGKDDSIFSMEKGIKSSTRVSEEFKLDFRSNRKEDSLELSQILPIRTETIINLEKSKDSVQTSNYYPTKTEETINVEVVNLPAINDDTNIDIYLQPTQKVTKLGKKSECKEESVPELDITDVGDSPRLGVNTIHSEYTRTNSPDINDRNNDIYIQPTQKLADFEGRKSSKELGVASQYLKRSVAGSSQFGVKEKLDANKLPRTQSPILNDPDNDIYIQPTQKFTEFENEEKPQKESDVIPQYTVPSASETSPFAIKEKLDAEKLPWTQSPILNDPDNDIYIQPTQKFTEFENEEKPQKESDVIPQYSMPSASGTSPFAVKEKLDADKLLRRQSPIINNLEKDIYIQPTQKFTEFENENKPPNESVVIPQYPLPNEARSSQFGVKETLDTKKLHRTRSPIINDPENDIYIQPTQKVTDIEDENKPPKESVAIAQYPLTSLGGVSQCGVKEKSDSKSQSPSVNNIYLQPTQNLTELEDINIKSETKETNKNKLMLIFKNPQPDNEKCTRKSIEAFDMSNKEESQIEARKAEFIRSNTDNDIYFQPTQKLAGFCEKPAKESIAFSGNSLAKGEENEFEKKSEGSIVEMDDLCLQPTQILEKTEHTQNENDLIQALSGSNTTSAFYGVVPKPLNFEEPQEKTAKSSLRLKKVNVSNPKKITLKGESKKRITKSTLDKVVQNKVNDSMEHSSKISESIDTTGTETNQTLVLLDSKCTKTTKANKTTVELGDIKVKVPKNRKSMAVSVLDTTSVSDIKSLVVDSIDCSRKAKRSRVACDFNDNTEPKVSRTQNKQRSSVVLERPETITTRTRGRQRKTYSDINEMEPSRSKKPKCEILTYQIEEDVQKPQIIPTRKKRRTTLKGVESSESSNGNSRDSSCSTPKKQKLVIDDSSQSSTERSKRKSKPKVVFTMMDDPQLESFIRRLGGSIVDTVETCTVLVTNSVKRSKKLLSAVGLGKPVCSPKWITDSKDSNTFLDPWDYILTDKEAESKWDFSLKESINRSCQKKLYENYSFQLVVSAAADVLKGAIEACGGKVVSRNPGKGIHDFYIVSVPENRSKYAKYLKNSSSVKVIEPEAIFDGVLRQQIRFENHYLS